jgi:hypothetical protein
MACNPLLIAPFLLSVAILELVVSPLIPQPTIDPQDPQVFTQTLFGAALRWMALNIASEAVLHTLAVGVVSCMVVHLILGARASPGAALYRAAIRLPVALGASVLLFLRLLVGFMLLIVPGLIALVQGILLSQATIIGNAGDHPHPALHPPGRAGSDHHAGSDSVGIRYWSFQAFRRLKFA